MSGFLTLAKLAFSGPRLATLAGTNTLAVRAYATKKVFIASIPWKTTDEELKDFLSQYGSLSDSYFPKDPMGRTSGYGFVELDESEADAFIREVDGREFKGRPLKAQPANPRPERSERRDGERGEFRPRRDFNDRNRRDGGEGQSYRRANDRGNRGYGGGGDRAGGYSDRPYKRDGERGPRGDGGFERE